MNKTNDGGPAFPVSSLAIESMLEAAKDAPAAACEAIVEKMATASTGMLLRDYFAAKALQGLIAEPISEGHYSTAYVIGGGNSTDPATNFARAAYLLADAMLKARAE